MTDNVPNDNVDDVLTSIRRLVADKKTAGQGAPVVSDDRLVLTPALRVPDASDIKPLDLASVAQESIMPKDKGETVSDQDVLKQQDAAALSTDIAAELHEEAAQGTSALTAKITALETAIGSIHSEFEPDNPESVVGVTPIDWEEDVDLDATGAPSVAEADAPLAEMDAEAPAEADAASDHSSDEDEEGSTFVPVHTRRRKSRILMQTVPAEEEGAQDAVDDASDTEMPETSDIEDDLSDVVAQDVAADAVDEVELETDQVDSTENTGTEVAAKATGTELNLDDAALHDMIVEIVHQELSGALGERITRNVRKLVRREIYRALAAQELD